MLLGNLLGALVVLATLPLMVELLVLTTASLLPARRPQNDGADVEAFRLAVLIPAHNEAGLVGRAVESVRASAGAGTEVVVVAHNCSDSTAAQAERAGALVLRLDDPQKTGKGAALSFGFGAALAAGADAVLVVDADSVVDSGLVGAVRRRLMAGAQAVQCRYEVLNPERSRRTELMAIAFHGFNVVRPRGRGRLGLSVGIFGNGFALSREVLQRVTYGAYSIVEDMEYHLALVKAGIRVEFVDAAIRGEMPASAKGAHTQRARWEGGRLQMMRRWIPSLAASVLRGQARLAEPLLDLLSLPIATGVLLLMMGACLPVEWLRIYAAAGFAVLLFHIGAGAAGGLGFGKTLRALTAAPGYVIWKLWMMPRIWRASQIDAGWIRTERESTADGG